MYKEENYRPNAKINDIVTQNCADELVIYNLITNKAYCLNNPLAEVWQLCDGQRDISIISAELSKKTGMSVTEDYVWLCLNELQTKGLVSLPDSKTLLTNSNRRKLIKQVGLTTAVALPMLTLLVAPKASNAASNGGTCNPALCDSNCCFNDACTPVNPGGLPDGASCFGEWDCQSDCCPAGVCVPACDFCYPH